MYHAFHLYGFVHGATIKICCWGAHSKEVGTTMRAKARVQANKVLRTSLASQLDSAASTFGERCAAPEGIVPKKEKRLKACMLHAIYCLDIWLSRFLQVLTAEQQQKKDFDKDLAKSCSQPILRISLQVRRRVSFLLLEAANYVWKVPYCCNQLERIGDSIAGGALIRINDINIFSPLITARQRWKLLD